MNYIVLVKQVPDIQRITSEAWDMEKGTLIRAKLDNVINPLDEHAVTFTYRMREASPYKDSKIVFLTMGPPFAKDVLDFSLSRSLSRDIDEAVLLTDKSLGGADTIATSYPLSQAIKKIQQDIFKGNDHYIIVAGMQSVDGDTAQVPPQVAEKLGIDVIAYVDPRSFSYDGNKLILKRICPSGVETISPMQYPVLITTTKGEYPLFASFARTDWAYDKEIYVWDAKAIEADENRIGVKGSKTQVIDSFFAKQAGIECNTKLNIDQLLDVIEKRYHSEGPVTSSEEEREKYNLKGRKPFYTGEVWVYTEQIDGKISSVSYELLAKSRELAESIDQKVGIILAGHEVEDLSQSLISYGADKVYLVEHPLLQQYHLIAHKKAIASLIEKYKPQIVLYGATPWGRVLAPLVSSTIECGLTADCTGLDICSHGKRGKIRYDSYIEKTVKIQLDDFFKLGRDEVADFLGLDGKELGDFLNLGKIEKREQNQEIKYLIPKSFGLLMQIRPALGGNVMANILTKESYTQMATVRPGTFKAQEPDYHRKGEKVRFEPTIFDSDIKTRIIQIEPLVATTTLANADIIVSGGAGLGASENFERYLKPLADELSTFLDAKVQIGASRAAVDSELISRDHQVGQTGQTVQPKLYIAVGISGAQQHLVGMQNSETIIAVNKNPNERIFHSAHYGVVGDYQKIILELISTLKKRNQLRRVA